MQLFNFSLMFTPTVSVLLMCLLSLPSLPAAAAGPANVTCNGTSIYTAKSTYESNLNLLLSSLVSNGSRSGFSNATIGQTPDRVYGLVLCRGDVNTSDCSSCLGSAARDILHLCPYNRGAAVWYEPCLLRYSDEDFLFSTQYFPEAYVNNTLKLTSAHWSGEYLTMMMHEMAYLTASSEKRFATGEVPLKQSPTIYWLGQCTPDLSPKECQGCLDRFIDQTLEVGIEVKQGEWAIGTRCNFRYEVYKFYYGAPTTSNRGPVHAGPLRGDPSQPPPPALPGSHPSPPVRPSVARPPAGEAAERSEKKEVRTKVLAIATPLVAALVLISVVSVYHWRRGRRRSTKRLLHETNVEEITSVHESLLLDLSTLRVATTNFAEANKLGQGGFGAVYKGVLPDGQEVAVKRLSANSKQGIGELINELALVAKLQHKNHVRLLGVCLEGDEKLLVYEYVPNRSLDTFLFDATKREKLDWGLRYKIIGGIARGLLYLHEDSQLKIIHRDLKASNVLLDADMNPKISDFGLARLFDADQTQGATNRIVGTFGYMAPEYALFGQFSIKTDVYSFGVLVLEIVTGRKNISFSDPECARGLPSYVWEQRNKGLVTEIIDPFICDNCPIPEVLRCIDIGLLCVQENPSGRPSMSTVVLMLNSNSMLLPAPSRPAFCFEKGGMVSYVCSSEVHEQIDTDDDNDIR